MNLELGAFFSLAIIILGCVFAIAAGAVVVVNGEW
jgi:hypothetical protein